MNVNERMTPGRILVVDDSATTRALVQHILESAHYSVKTAVNVFDALHILDFETFDMIITDFNMPEMNGAEFLKILRRDPKTATMPVILLTGSLSLKQRKDGSDSGANAYILKEDCNQTVLVETMEKIFNGLRIKQDAAA